MEAPFKSGDFVRIKKRFASRFKYKTGVVVEVEENSSISGPFWWVHIKRSNSSDLYAWFIPSRDNFQWELSPLEDWRSDEVSTLLAQSVLDGNLDAALLLADRIFEIYGGTKSYVCVKCSQIIACASSGES